MDRLSPAAQKLLREYRRGHPGRGGAGRNYRAVMVQMRRSEREREAEPVSRPGWMRQLGWGLASAAAAIVLLLVADTLLPKATGFSPASSLTPSEAADRAAPGAERVGSLVRPPAVPAHSVPPPPVVHASPELARQPSVKPVSGTATPDGPDALAEETKLLEATRDALRKGDLSGARAALDEHGRRFPKGGLAEDRAAYDVILLCRAKDSSAVKRRAAFFEVYPRSPHAPRIAEACNDPR